MINDDDWFTKEPQGSRDTQFAPQEGNRMDLLYGYKPKTAEELAEWLVMASMNVVDKDGLRVMYMIPPYAAYQIARMMQIAKLKVPK